MSKGPGPRSLGEGGSTRTILFGILMIAGRRLTASQVILLARPLGISATNVKSHLTRMVAEGAILRKGPARSAWYWPSPSQMAVVEAVLARLEETAAEDWNGTWILLTLSMPARRGERERTRAALWFDGFRPWGPTAFSRPAWPETWALERARRHLEGATGLAVHGALVGRMDLAAVATLYDLDSLDREARRRVRWVRDRRVPRDSEARAWALRLTVGGLVARFIGHDPRLPSAIWGKRTGIRSLVRAFHHFDARVAPLAERFLSSVLAPSSAKLD